MKRLHFVWICSITLSLTISTTLSQAQDHQSSSKAVAALSKWLEQPRADRGPIAEQPFDKTPLSKDDAAKAQAMLWKDHEAFVRSERADEWNNKVIVLGDYAMKFEYKTFGDKPEGGHSLFISMHGGGNAPARVNDQQWRNQIGLYEPDEGIYLAPRAPTNEWNLWHLPHIDDFFDRTIEDAVVLADVNPNRVYIMGYSAGGDGVYQLAPRMADRLAAAAMMAGHPNDANPLGLRNIGFTLHVGGDDGAYNRNQVAAEWKEKLDELQKSDPQGYVHEVQIHKGKGHWMDREDQVAVPWMEKFTRNPLPDKVVWFQDDVTHDRFYWLAVPEGAAVKSAEIVATREGQIAEIEKAAEVPHPILRLNDEMLDLDRPVTVSYQGHSVFKGTVPRTIGTIAKTLQERGDPASIYSAELYLDLTQAGQ